MTHATKDVMQGGYACIWEFVVPAARRMEFERDYGPGGRWVALFRSAPGYLGTLLLHDDAMPGRYLTVDRWRSEADYRDFRTTCAALCDALDRECASLTLAERSIGNFTQVGS